MTKAVVPLMKRQNNGVTVENRSNRRWKTKGFQRVNSTMASTNSNHRPTAILHRTRRTIKYYLAAKVGKLTNRHKAHREAGNMGDLGYREGRCREVTIGGDW